MWLLLVFSLWGVVVTEPSCRTSDSDPYVMFSTKTSYHPGQPTPNAEQVPEDCTAVTVWGLVRHGTRYGPKRVIKGGDKTLPKLRQKILESGTSNMCRADLELLQKWRPEYDVTMKKQLSDAGYAEIRDLAQRHRDLYPSLLQLPYSNLSYEFRHTTEQRTKDTALAWSAGLWGSNITPYLPEPVKDDPLLMFYSGCPRWKQEVEQNETMLKEQKEFEKGPEMTSVLESVKQRLGLQNTLDIDDIMLLYDTCRFDKALHPHQKSPWCVVFSDYDLKILEYLEDLEYYWINSYGNQLNYEITCPLVEDYVNKIRSAWEGDSSTKGTFYFTHSSSMIMFLTRMGIFDDSEVLHSNNFSQDRRFRTSNITPFGANFVSVLYNCSGVPELRTMVQEVPVKLNACKTPVCELDELNSYVTDECNFDEMCQNP